ncbi:MAG: hypothetical protein NZM05_12610, partial [Chloroherpetonaceae bacterium]|nr:hypothetical protein [Chloroherpetonaceae bacterium]
DEVPDAIQNIDGMSVVSQSDMQPSADMEVMDEGAAEMDQAGQESPEDMDQEALSSEEGMGGMEGGEEMAAAEGGEEEVEKSKKRESASRSSKSAKTEDNFVQSFIRTFESAYAPKSTFGYALEEDVPFSIMKQGDKFAMGKLFDGEDPPTEYKEKMVDGLKETTFKGGYRSKLPEKPDESEVRKDTPGDKEAKATYKKSQQPIKSDSDIKYENRFSSHRSTRRVRPFKI